MAVTTILHRIYTMNTTDLAALLGDSLTPTFDAIPKYTSHKNKAVYNMDVLEASIYCTYKGQQDNTTKQRHELYGFTLSEFTMKVSSMAGKCTVIACKTSITIDSFT